MKLIALRTTFNLISVDCIGCFVLSIHDFGAGPIDVLSDFPVHVPHADQQNSRDSKDNIEEDKLIFEPSIDWVLFFCERFVKRWIIDIAE